MKIPTKERLARTALAVMAGILVFGCAGSKEEIRKDPFFEQWQLKAEESIGTSPAPRVRSLRIPDDPGSAGVTAEQKTLPTMKVTLVMRDTDIRVALLTLAKAAGQNILIKSEVQGKINVDFRKVRWDEAFLSIMRSRMLTYVWDGDIIRITTAADLQNDLALEKIARERREQRIMTNRLSPLLSMVVPVNYADPEKLKKNLESFLTRDDKGTPYGSIRVDEHTNSLVIQATRSDLERIVPMVDEIDKPTPQIRIEANIVETTKETARELGIQWGGSYGGTTGPYHYSLSGGTAGSATVNSNNMAVDFPVGDTAITTAGGVSALGLAFGTVGGNILEMQLTALQSKGKLNILSSPSITTLDNQMAFTENGERVPFVSYSDGDQEVSWEDAVLRLEITPHVIDGQTLKMKILVKKDEVDTSRTVAGNPFIIKKQTDTTLMVRDGETIVISGLSKQRNSSGDSGVPGLKDVPGLGYLFKADSRAETMEEVLIFITPRILKPEVVSQKTNAPG